jgi:hypothetical protein
VQLFNSAATTLGFFLAQLDKVQVNYSAFDRELFAMMAAIRHLCFMPEGKSFFVFTDHKPLVGALNRSSDLWLAHQQHHLFFNVKFAPTTRHVIAVSNIVADTLSRPAGDFSLPPALMQLKDGCVTACDSAVSPGGAAAVLVSCPDNQRASSSTSL